MLPTIVEEENSETPFVKSHYHIRGLALVDAAGNGTDWQGNGAKWPFVLVLKMTRCGCRGVFPTEETARTESFG